MHVDISIWLSDGEDCDVTRNPSAVEENANNNRANCFNKAQTIFKSNAVMFAAA